MIVGAGKGGGGGHGSKANRKVDIPNFGPGPNCPLESVMRHCEDLSDSCGGGGGTAHTDTTISGQKE